MSYGEIQNLIVGTNSWLLLDCWYSLIGAQESREKFHVSKCIIAYSSPKNPDSLLLQQWIIEIADGYMKTLNGKAPGVEDMQFEDCEKLWKQILSNILPIASQVLPGLKYSQRSFLRFSALRVF